MKKIFILLILIFLLSITSFAQAQYNYLGIGLVSVSNISLYQLSQNQAQFFNSAMWGLNAKLKLSKFFGFSANLIYVGRQYYVYRNDLGYWMGPDAWEIIQPYAAPGGIFGPEDWNYYHDEFYSDVNIGFYLPIFFLQLYFECGPSFILTKISEEAEGDSSFTNYYYSIYEEGGFTLGLTFKIGVDVFFTRSISLSLFVIFIEPNFQTFFNNIANNTEDYFLNNGYVGLNMILWL